MATSPIGSEGQIISIMNAQRGRSNLCVLGTRAWPAGPVFFPASSSVARVDFIAAEYCKTERGREGKFKAVLKKVGRFREGDVRKETEAGRKER